MQKCKVKKKQTVSNKKTIKTKPEENIIALGEIEKQRKRIETTKLKIAEESAEIGDLKKLEQLKQFNKDTTSFPDEALELIYILIEDRIRQLKSMSERLEYHIEQNNLKGIMPEWKKIRTMDISRWKTKKMIKIYEEHKWSFEHLFEFEFDSWNEYFRSEHKIVDDFLYTGEYYGLEYMPIDDFAEEDGVYNVLKNNCDLYIKLFENYKRANEVAHFLSCLLDDSNNSLAQFHHLDGRLSLKAKQRKSKSNSGKGQQEAQIKRVQKLAERLKNNFNDASHSISITKNEFCRLVSETFVGRELYPRHPAIIRDYHKKVEQFLSIRINLTRN